MSASAKIASHLPPPQPAPRKVDINVIRNWIEAGANRSELNVLVTPKIAEMMLEYNAPGQTNRPLSKRAVENAEAAMRAGDWENTGEPIIFSDIRTMNDGQHRLYSLAASGLSVPMDLRFGVVRHAFANTNSGRKRTGGDALALIGTKNPNELSAMARLVLAYANGTINQFRAPVANGKIVAALERWPDMADSLRYSINLKRPFGNAAVKTMAFFASRTNNPPVIEEFFEVIRTGGGLSTHPAHQWREFMIATRGAYDNASKVKVLGFGILAWNQFRAAGPDRAKKITYRANGPFPQVDGLKL